MKKWKALQNLEIIFDNGHETWLWNGKSIAEIYAHINFRSPGQEFGEIFFAEPAEFNSEKLSFHQETPLGVYNAEYIVQNGMILLETSLELKKDWTGGIDLNLFKRPESYEHCRFYDMMDSGWSNTKSGILFTPLFSGGPN